MKELVCQSMGSMASEKLSHNFIFQIKVNGKVLGEMLNSLLLSGYMMYNAQGRLQGKKDQDRMK